MAREGRPLEVSVVTRVARVSQVGFGLPEPVL
jgi:hypothetical protein